jgi:hypothetical protein
LRSNSPLSRSSRSICTEMIRPPKGLLISWATSPARVPMRDIFPTETVLLSGASFRNQSALSPFPGSGPVQHPPWRWAFPVHPAGGHNGHGPETPAGTGLQSDFTIEGVAPFEYSSSTSGRFRSQNDDVPVEDLPGLNSNIRSEYLLKKTRYPSRFVITMDSMMFSRTFSTNSLVVFSCPK